MFHRCIAVLLVAVSIFLHTAPVVMAESNSDNPVDQRVGDLSQYTGVTNAVNVDVTSFKVDTSLYDALDTGNFKVVDGLWQLPDFDKFFADNPYISQLICMTPGFISDLLNIAAGIFSLLGPFLGVFGVMVKDPENTITNIQQLMTMTQQLKSQFEQCQVQKRINSVLGTTALPIYLATFIPHSFGRYGETSFIASVRSDNPQWFGSAALNSPQGILATGLNALSTVQLFTGVIGEITGDAGIKQLAGSMADNAAKTQSLINVVFASMQVFTNAFSGIGAGGNVITTAQWMAGTVFSVMGPFKKADEGVDQDAARQATLEAAKRAIADEEPENPNDESNAGKLKIFKDKTLSGGNGSTGAATAAQMHNLIEQGLTGKGSTQPKADCEVTVTRYRLDAARNCALKCAATSINYVNNNAIKVQQLVSNSGGCVVAGQKLPKSLCPTLTEVVANSGSVRGDIQSLVAIEFYGLTADLARGEVTALCTACEGIKGLIGTPTGCQ